MSEENIDIEYFKGKPEYNILLMAQHAYNVSKKTEILKQQLEELIDIEKSTLNKGFILNYNIVFRDFVLEKLGQLQQKLEEIINR